MTVVITSSRGQIVIPREIRKKLQIFPGKRILVRAEENHAVLDTFTGQSCRGILRNLQGWPVTDQGFCWRKGRRSGSVKRKKLLDSFAILSYLNREAGFQKVLDIMADAHESGEQVFMNEVNIGEVYYILFRKRGYENQRISWKGSYPPCL
jgi:AbrB family looped-hinge helix DNA binding protein